IGATMNQKPSLTQQHQSVYQILTPDTEVPVGNASNVADQVEELFNTHMLAINSNQRAVANAISIMQSMLISSVAGVDGDLEAAMTELAEMSQLLVAKTVEEPDQDTPGLNIIQRKFEEQEMSKSPIADEKEAELDDDELERD
ncbi:hypothetical protein, partial [Maritalea porphyrae]|uniref:hypothetical protein n=1 Tax=Maritalea porphyrae TaxID=880732 RepID=UPI0022AF8730